jgi:RHS repeat-associated protein
MARRRLVRTLHRVTALLMSLTLALGSSPLAVAAQAVDPAGRGGGPPAHVDWTPERLTRALRAGETASARAAFRVSAPVREPGFEVWPDDEGDDREQRGRGDDRRRLTIEVDARGLPARLEAGRTYTVGVRLIAPDDGRGDRRGRPADHRADLRGRVFLTDGDRALVHPLKVEVDLRAGPPEPRTPTPTVTATRATTVTVSPTATASATRTATATGTRTPTSTATATASATATATASASATETASATPAATATPTETVTATATASETVTASATATQTASATVTETATATLTPTWTPTETPTSALPPDPAQVAPPLDPSVASDLATASLFLYSGANPIQTGVAAGAIDPLRVAVLRGAVVDRDGQPVPGATISVLHGSDYGQTLSRADGQFDLAVNGGGRLTVRYEKSGYLPAQREVEPGWRDYAQLPEVVLVALDSRVTTVDLSPGAPMQVARGSVVSDGAGSRQATLLFPTGTTASLMAGGQPTQPLSTLNIRATEYTVGSNGPRAMPAELPSSSFYTYAVELSADEVEAAGATGLRFSRPVPMYLENFLHFPVGETVPVGRYDREGGHWVAEENGRVVGVLTTAGGLADLDLDGDGLADGPAALAALGIDDAERQQLALLYQPGQSLWRVPIPHFSVWDCNWPFGPPEDAGDPDQDEPRTDTPEGEQCQGHGYSTIECQNQVLIETLEVAHTPFKLSYRSDRTPARRAANTLTIPLSGPTPPASLARIDLEVHVAGRLLRQSFTGAPNQSYRFTWDGRDAYGRALSGEQSVKVRIGYTYGGVSYLSAGAGARSFARWSSGTSAGGRAIIGDMARQTLTFWQEYQSRIGVLDARALGLGGWTLDVQHAYDPGGQTLHLGDGRRRGAAESSRLAQLTMESAGFGFSVDGVAVGADGAIYVPNTARHTIRRYTADGSSTDVVGTGIAGFNGDSSALQTRVNTPRGLAPGPGGFVTVPVLNDQGQPIGSRQVGRAALYFADTGNHRVREVLPGQPGGIEFVHTLAGTGTAGFSGDGFPGTSARLSSPTGLAVGPDGSLYIADTGNNRIRRISPPASSAWLDGGTIETVAGTGVAGYGGDGGPATRAQLNAPQGLAVGADGSLYIADTGNNRVRWIGPDGVIRTLAGNGVRGTSEDGLVATESALNGPRGVAPAGDGSVFLSDSGTNRVRRVLPNGTLTTVAGRLPGFPGTGDGGPALAVSLNAPGQLTFGPGGELYVADTGGGAVRRIASDFPAPGLTGYLLPADDGLEAYLFDAGGRHVRTMHGLTGATRYSFGYDLAQRLVSVTDGDGNVTTIERAADGSPTAIVGPYGQRTTLELDANGYLAALTTPGNERHQVAHAADGALTSRTTPRLQVYRFEYEPATGRLTRAEDPAGGFTALARTETAGGYRVTRTDAPGLNRSYTVERLALGGQRRLVGLPDGTQVEMLRVPDGSQRITYPDGTVRQVVTGPDPRWGMQAPIVRSMTTSWPSGRSSTLTASRSVTLADALNPLSLETQTDTVSDDFQTTTTTFDAATMQLTALSPAGRRVVGTLDAQGRVRQEGVSGLAPTEYGRDARGRLASMSEGVGATARTFGLSYGADGQPNELTDPLAQTFGLGYDAVGRMTSLTAPDGGQTRYGYDANGNVSTIAPPGRPAHSFGHSPVDLESSYAPPALATGGDETTYGSRPDRQLDRIERPGGQTLAYQYDAAGRLDRLTLTRGAIQHGYDPTTGNLATIAAPGGLGLAYRYDGDQPTDETWTGAVPGHVQHSYDGQQRVSSQAVDGGSTAYFSYDPDGLLIWAGSLSLTHDPQHGLVSGTTLGGVSDSWSYNELGEPTSYGATANGLSAYQVQYTRDPLGRISGKTETIGGQVDSYTYGYDPAGRLATVERNGLMVASYQYDRNGNRLSATGASGVVLASYDDRDRLTAYGATTYDYTPNGDLRTRSGSGATTTYEYDGLGNLTGVTLPGGARVDYLIDGRNRRIGKRLNGALVQGLLYQDQLEPIAELDAAGNVVSRFVYASREHVPDYMEKGGNLYRIVSDDVGSPRLVIEVWGGAVVQRLDYDAFGNVTFDSNPGFQPFGFAGGLYDRDTKLTRFGSRDYDAEVGRWTARDPILFAGRDSNLYAYAFNDPLNLIDPSGEILPLVAAGAACALGSYLWKKYGEGAGCDGKPKKEGDMIAEAALDGALCIVAGGALSKAFKFLNTANKAEKAVKSGRIVNRVTRATANQIKGQTRNKGV